MSKKKNFAELESYDLTITWRNIDGSDDSKVYEFTSNVSSSNNDGAQ